MNQKEFIDRYNALTGVFLRKFGEADRNQNIVFSPFSIISLLSILADAAGGSTRREVQDLLYGGGWHHKGFADQLKAVRQELTRKEDYSDWLDYEDPYFGKPILDREDHLCTANAVFVREDYKDTIRSSFRKLLVDAYDGGLFSSPDLQGALGQWSREATREMLPLLEEIVKSDSLLAMINTVFFHALWQWPYEEEDVKEGVFQNADHTDSRVIMLHGGEDSYVENRHAAGFVKEFQQCDYCFMALLPKQEGSEALCATVESVDFHDLMEHQRHDIVNTMMPEFKASFRTEMKNLLSSLGIRKAFTPVADFSSLSSAPLMADKLVHQAKIEVDRNGARAAAATAMICVGACPPEEEKYVIIDRPFVFAVLNRELKIPVFVGVVNQIDEI